MGLRWLAMTVRWRHPGPYARATAGGSDAGLEVVADDLPRNTAEAGERADMATDPVRQRLRPARLSIGEVGRTENCHEHLCRPELARGPVDHLGHLPSIVDKHALTHRMRLAHRRRQPAAPLSMQVAEPAVTIPIRLLSPVDALRAPTLPQQQ